ncbi:MAG TPA: HAMP domain-containing sensor histidine kinase [Acidothermaceae bacterium]
MISPTPVGRITDKLHGFAGPTLRARVSLLAAATAGFAVAVVSLAAYLTMRVELFHQLDVSLKSRANAAADLRLDPQSTFFDQSSLFLLTAENKVFFVSSDGEVFGSTQDRSFAKPLATGSELAVARGDQASSIRTLRVSGSDYRVAAVHSGPGQAVVLARSMTETTTTLEHLGVVLLSVGVAGIALAAIAGLVVARAGLRPVERLTKATEDIARTGQLEPIDIQSDDELGRLATSFNSMLVALDVSRTRQRQLVADAGHELRTPLTSLRTNLDLLAQSDAAGDRGLSPAERHALLVDVRAQVEELSGLVSDLVELARDEAPSATFEDVDLVAVTERAIERVRRRGPDVRIDVVLEPWTVHGEASTLERAVTNLLDNAVKWSPPNGQVRVRLAGGRLTVEDDGPGISDADLPHVFDRFYRSTDARAMPGSGLGLAIVRQAAERHGGSVSAGRADSGGALMALDLPGRPSAGDSAEPGDAWFYRADDLHSSFGSGSAQRDSGNTQRDAGASAS